VVGSRDPARATKLQNPANSLGYSENLGKLGGCAQCTKKGGFSHPENERTRTRLQSERESSLQTRVSGSVTDLVTVFFFYLLGLLSPRTTITTIVHLVVLWSVALFIARS